MTELLTRRRADWSPYEDAKLLEYKKNGMTNFQIGQKLGRSETGVRMHLEKLQTPVVVSPMYNIPTPVLQQPALSIIADITSDEQEYIQSTFQRFNTTQEAIDYLLKHPFIASPRTPPKSSWRWW
jgi:hypothetical protein